MKFKEVVSKFKAVLLDKKDFFKKIKKEKTIKKGFFYFFVLTALIMLIVTNRYVNQINEMLSFLYLESGLEYFNVNLVLTPGLFIFFYLLFLVFFVLFAFVRYWLVHVTVKLFRPDALYKDTYNSLSYSVTPGYLAMPFFAFGVFLLFFENFRLVAFLLLLIYVLLEGYSFYIRSKGLAETHDLSFFNGFMCLYVYSNILFVASFVLFFLGVGFVLSFLNYLVLVFL